jgi:hypothetical protein
MKSHESDGADAKNEESDMAREEIRQEPPADPPSGGVLSWFDAYGHSYLSDPKLRTKTLIGGCVSVLAVAVCFVLVALCFFFFAVQERSIIFDEMKQLTSAAVPRASNFRLSYIL